MTVTKLSVRVLPTGKVWQHAPEFVQTDYDDENDQPVGYWREREEAFYQVYITQNGKSFWYGPETSQDGAQWYAEKAKAEFTNENNPIADVRDPQPLG